MASWIERQRKIIDFTISSLARRTGKNIALLFVYTLIVFVLASVVFFVHAIKKEASIILQDAPEIIIQRTVAGRQDLIRRVLERIVPLVEAPPSGVRARLDIDPVSML